MNVLSKKPPVTGYRGHEGCGLLKLPAAPNDNWEEMQRSDRYESAHSKQIRNEPQNSLGIFLRVGRRG